MTTEAVPVTPVETKPKFNYGAALKDFFVNILGQIRILKKIYPGIMHALIFWGMTILAFGHIVTLMQMVLFVPFIELPFPRENFYLYTETLGDIAGLAVLLGLLMALFRRLVLRPSYLESRWDDYYAIFMLALIPLMGYFNEGFRIVAANPAWANWSFVGNFTAGLLRSWGLTAETATQYHWVVVTSHIVVGLVFAGSIPFTKLRHLFAAPLNILARVRKEDGELDPIDDIENAELLGVGQIEEFTTLQMLSFDACLNCGRCEDSCPATAVGMDYSPRELIQTLRATMQDTLVAPQSGNGHKEIFNSEYSWACTTCGACIVKCPAFVNPVDQVIDLRRYQVLTTGQMPKMVGDTLRNLERQGNPWGIPPQDRTKWSEGLNLRVIKPGEKVDVLLYFGCAMAFDERNKKIARALVQLLNKHNVDFAYLGMDEGCCGETARRMGHEYVYQVMAEQNIEIFESIEFNKIVTQCPHCFNTLKNEYPHFGGEFEVVHLTEFLAGLPGSNSKAVQNGHKVTFHDPCYLGRYNSQFDAPRELLKNAGISMSEMKQNKMDSFCCGGGGGQMWMETDAETRVNHQRLQNAIDTQADTVITSCPYCLTMFEDAIGAKGLGEQIQVKDIIEVLLEVE